MDPNQEKIQGNTLTTPTGVQVDLTTGQPITGQALTPAPSANFAAPSPTLIPSVTGLDSSTPAPATLTPEEKQAQDLTTRLQQINDSLVGKSAYQTEQENAAGIPDLQKTQTDLSTKLKSLQNEALAIPQQLQLSSEGRGITAGGLAPIQSAALRNNAIQALGVSSLLEASRGNIATAQDMVDRAVAAKYGPLEEEQKAKLANLDLILKSPAYSLADKNRAAAQKAIEDAKAAQIADAKKNEEEARAKTLEYAGIANSAQLAEMSKAKTALEVAQIAAKYGLRTADEQYKAAQTKSLLASANAKTPVVNSDGTQNYSTIDISRYSRAANAIVKNFIGLPQYNLTANGLPYLQRIQAADSIPGSVSDAELLDSIVKLNTGGNQVTEAQVRLITGGKSFADALNVWENKLQNGGVLSDNQRQQLTQLATKVFERYQKDYQPIYEQATKQLKAAGIPEAFWTIPDLTTLSNQESNTGGNDPLGLFK